MMEQLGQPQTCLMIVDLDQFVPQDHLLRKIKAKVDFAFIHEPTLCHQTPPNRHTSAKERKSVSPCENFVMTQSRTPSPVPGVNNCVSPM
ncbi:MAG: hypothetical protein ACM3ZA_00605 [Bacillota bacterium]